MEYFGDNCDETTASPDQTIFCPGVQSDSEEEQILVVDESISEEEILEIKQSSED